MRLKSNLKNIKTIIFTKRSFFYTILGFTESHPGVLGDIPGFVQFIPGTYKSNRPINITGLDKILLKTDCIHGSIVNGVRETIIYSSGPSSPPGHQFYSQSKITPFKKINKPVLSHITFYLEDDDHKPVDFNNETISLTCQLIKIQYSYLYTYHYMSTYTRGIHTNIRHGYIQLYDTYNYMSFYTRVYLQMCEYF